MIIRGFIFIVTEGWRRLASPIRQYKMVHHSSVCEFRHDELQSNISTEPLVHWPTLCVTAVLVLLLFGQQRTFNSFIYYYFLKSISQLFRRKKKLSILFSARHLSILSAIIFQFLGPELSFLTACLLFWSLPPTLFHFHC